MSTTIRPTTYAALVTLAATLTAVQLAGSEIDDSFAPLLDEEVSPGLLAKCDADPTFLDNLRNVWIGAAAIKWGLTDGLTDEVKADLRLRRAAYAGVLGFGLDSAMSSVYFAPRKAAHSSVKAIPEWDQVVARAGMQAALPHIFGEMDRLLRPGSPERAALAAASVGLPDVVVDHVTFFALGGSYTRMYNNLDGNVEVAVPGKEGKKFSPSFGYRFDGYKPISEKEKAAAEAKAAEAAKAAAPAADAALPT